MAKPKRCGQGHVAAPPATKHLLCLTREQVDETFAALTQHAAKLTALLRRSRDRRRGVLIVQLIAAEKARKQADAALGIDLSDERDIPF